MGVPACGVCHPWVQLLVGEPEVGGFGSKWGGETGVDDLASLVGRIEGEDDLAVGGPAEVGEAPGPAPLHAANKEAAHRYVTIFRMFAKRGQREDTVGLVP